MALPAILAGLGGSLGTNVVGKVMEKTLPKAAEFLATTAKAPFDMFESIVQGFGGKASKTEPAQQFSLSRPPASAQLVQSGGAGRLKSILGNLPKLMEVLKSLGDLMQNIQQLFGKGPSPAQATGTPPGGAAGTAGTGTPQPMSAQDMVQQVQSDTVGGGSGPGGSGSGPSGPGGAGGPLSDQYAMLNKMQQAQKAAQMFELAVKMSEMQHQAAMSAIRGIKY